MPTVNACKDESPGSRTTWVWSRSSATTGLPTQLDARRNRDASGVATAARAYRQLLRLRLILMGDWCDSRHHATKRWMRCLLAGTGGGKCCAVGGDTHFGHRKGFICALYSGRLMGDPGLLKPSLKQGKLRMHGCAKFAVFSVIGTGMSKYPILGYLDKWGQTGSRDEG